MILKQEYERKIRERSDDVAYTDHIAGQILAEHLVEGKLVPGTEIGIRVRDRVREAVVVKKPFYTPAYRR